MQRDRGLWGLGQMENEAIMKPPHYSLSVLSSIRKINISTLSPEMNPKKTMEAEGGVRTLLCMIYLVAALEYSVPRNPGVLVTVTTPS